MLCPDDRRRVVEAKVCRAVSTKSEGRHAERDARRVCREASRVVGNEATAGGNERHPERRLAIAFGSDERDRAAIDRDGARMQAEVTSGVERDRQNASENVRSNELRVRISRRYPHERSAVVADIEGAGVRKGQTKAICRSLKTRGNPRDELLLAEDHAASKCTEGRASTERPVRAAGIKRVQLRKFDLCPEDAAEHFVVPHRLLRTTQRAPHRAPAPKRSVTSGGKRATNRPWLP